MLLTLLVSVTFAQAQVPGSPTNLVATPVNTGGMIQFTAPSSVGGSAITNYEYSTNNGATWITPSPAITASPIIISSGLTNCATYQVKLRAVNASGSSTASAAVNLTPEIAVDMGGIWVTRSSAADNNWTSVTYGNEIFVAVASSGTGNRVMTSPDGINWTIRNSAADNSWTSVTYGNGLFVAVASSGTGNRVMTSSDGINWISRTSAADNNWSSVTYGSYNGNPTFVAVASSGTGNRVMTSSNGTNWTLKTSAADYAWSSVTYGNGIFVAVSAGSISAERVPMVSSDGGSTWTLRTGLSATSSNQLWSSVTYGNGLFVAVGNSGDPSKLMTSSDGITWTGRTPGYNYPGVYGAWSSITYGNGRFVALGNSGIYQITSTDGINWSLATPVQNNQWTSVTYGNGMFVAVANSGTGNRVMSSSFTAISAPVITAISARDTAASVAFTQTTQTTLPNSPVINNYEYSTDNGSTWIARYPASYLSPMTITGLTNGTSYTIKLRAINASGTSCAVSNSFSVTPALGTVPDAPGNLAVTPTNSGGMLKFTAPANDGGSNITNYQYSTDNGATWITPSPAITASPLIISSGLTNCTTYSTKLRAVNASGSGTASAAINLTPGASVNMGVTWLTRTSITDLSWTGITYGNGLFVAIRLYDYSFMTSPDGINWTERTIPVSGLEWRGITYGNGLFVATASNGTGNRVMTSPDGINWTSRTSAADNQWWSVAYGNGTFVAVSSNGTNRVMTSLDGINWTPRTAAAAN